MFTTSRTTLGVAGYFNRLFEGDWQESGDDHIFVDRSPELFTHVLDYLRSGSVVRLPPFSDAPGLWRAPFSRQRTYDNSCYMLTEARYATW